MNWEDLRFVLAVARAGSLSGAGSTLEVTHTTVGRRLRAFEEELGVLLFDRTPDGLLATSAGEELIEVASRFESELVEAERRVVGQDTQLRGALRVSTLDFLLEGSRDVFASFIQNNPSVALTITSSTTPVSLARREADVVLRLSPSPPEGLVGRRVGKMLFAAFVSHELAERTEKSSEYTDYPWIGSDERDEAPGMNAWISAHVPDAKISARVDDNAALARSLVGAGVGAFLMPVWEAEALGLWQVGEALHEYATDVWLLTHPDLRNTSRVRAFLDHMSAELPKAAKWATAVDA